jgi:hypothetical protein
VNEFLLIEDCNEWGKNLADFIAIGNAVRQGQGGFWRTPAGTPFTSDLSGQDFLTLLQTGHTLVALVMGNCVYHVAHRGMITAMSQAYHNVELPNFYPSPLHHKGTCHRRMQYEGVVVVQITEKDHIWGHQCN